jgi:membrane-associated phospholipid phosphatase
MFGIVAVGSDLLKVIIARPRPFVTYAGEMIAFSDAETYALPSGHASKSTALALPFIILVAARDRWQMGVKILLGILALGVCYSRVVLGAHYVSDVLAGMGWALTSFPVATLLTNQILGKMDQERLNFAVKIWALVLLVLMLYLAVK